MTELAPDKTEIDKVLEKDVALLTILSKHGGLSWTGLLAKSGFTETTLVNKLEKFKARGWLYNEFRTYHLTPLGETQQILLQLQLELKNTRDEDFTLFEESIAVYHPFIPKHAREDAKKELEEWFIKGKALARKHGALLGVFKF